MKFLFNKDITKLILTFSNCLKIRLFRYSPRKTTLLRQAVRNLKRSLSGPLKRIAQYYHRLTRNRIKIHSTYEQTPLEAYRLESSTLRPKHLRAIRRMVPGNRQRGGYRAKRIWSFLASR